jgi:hypothetical protein
VVVPPSVGGEGYVRENGDRQIPFGRAVRREDLFGADARRNQFRTRADRHIRVDFEAVDLAALQVASRA